MSFTSARLDDIQAAGAGESVDGAGCFTLSASTFEDGIFVGRFVKLDAGSIDNLDASATPVIAGVVKRSVGNPIESGSTVDSSIVSQVEYQRGGLITVDVLAGQTPAKFGAVSVHNVAGADAGKARAAGGLAVNAEFIHEVRTDVWLVKLNLGA